MAKTPPLFFCRAGGAGAMAGAEGRGRYEISYIDFRGRLASSAIEMPQSALPFFRRSCCMAMCMAGMPLFSHAGREAAKKNNPAAPFCAILKKPIGFCGSKTQISLI